MPEISRFFGIIIRMFFEESEHNPPHIHVQHNEDKARIDVNTFEVISGKLSKKDLRLVKKWMKMHQAKLLKMWEERIIYEIVPLEKK